MRPPPGRHECRPYVYPTFITSHTAGISPPPPGRHECRPYVYPYVYPLYSTTPPARPATGDMNVAPTHMPDNHGHAQTATTRRGATCDARPTAGRQHIRPHACVRHPGDMNVAPTFTPRVSHHTRPAFRRRHPGDMNVAPTFIPTFITRHHPRGRRRALLLYMCPYDYEGGPCIPVLPRKKKKNRRERFLF